MKIKQLSGIWVVSIVCLLVGFMIAILYNSKHQEQPADNRDLWEIRMALMEEQEKQQQLYKDIEENEKLLSQYEEQSEQEQIDALKESIHTLEITAGLTEKKGPGVQITLEPIFVDNEEAMSYPELNAELLQYLINELNNYGATDIAIGIQRLINTSPIRNVNGKLYVNNQPIGDLPIQINVFSNDHEKLLNHLKVSNMNEYFALERISIISEVREEVIVPPYHQPIDFEGVELADIKGGEQ